MPILTKIRINHKGNNLSTCSKCRKTEIYMQLVSQTTNELFANIKTIRRTIVLVQSRCDYNEKYMKTMDAIQKQNF